MKKKKTTGSIENKKSRRNYEILETIEAGIALVGTEVKSLRAGKAEISDAYALPKDGELTLLNMRIEPYSHGGAFNHDETRTRKLLLHRKEIIKLASKIKESRLSVIPLKVYFNDRGVAKVLLGVGKGKKIADRREDEKKKEAQRDIERALRSANK